MINLLIGALVFGSVVALLVLLFAALTNGLVL